LGTLLFGYQLPLYCSGFIRGISSNFGDTPWHALDLPLACLANCDMRGAIFTVPGGEKVGGRGLGAARRSITHSSSGGGSNSGERERRRQRYLQAVLGASVGNQGPQGLEAPSLAATVGGRGGEVGRYGSISKLYRFSPPPIPSASCWCLLLLLVASACVFFPFCRYYRCRELDTTFVSSHVHAHPSPHISRFVTSA